MSTGLTRAEQWGLLGLVGLMLLGLGWREWRGTPRGENSVLAIEGQGTWRKLAELDATDSLLPAPAVAPGLAAGPGRADAAPALAPPAAPQPEANAPLTGQIDLNTADLALIESLPGIGPAKAEAILALRARLGRFGSVEQLNEVPGIGDKTLERLRPLVTVAAGGAAVTSTTSASTPAAAAAAAASTHPAPSIPSVGSVPSEPSVSAAATAINLNTASLAELETLPGIGPALAARIVQHRQAHGPFRTPAELDQVSGIGPKKLAQLLPLIRVQ